MADDAGALLVRSGLVSSSALDEARARVASHGGTLGEQLVTAGVISDDQLTEFYRQRLLVPQVNPNTLARLPQKVVAAIPSDMAIELRAIPVSLDGDNNLTVAMSDPSNRHAVDEISFFTGAYVVRAVATQMQIAWCLAHYYGHVTQLGARLIRPQRPAPAPAPASPAPAPAREPTKPLATVAAPRARSITGQIEAARHRAVAPSDGPFDAARPTSRAFDQAVLEAQAIDDRITETMAAVEPPAAPPAADAAPPAAPAAPPAADAAPPAAPADEPRLPSRQRAASIKPPVPPPHLEDGEEDEDEPVISIEEGIEDEGKGPRMIPVRRRVKTDPPELAARAGEVSLGARPERVVDDQPAIIIEDEALVPAGPVAGELHATPHRELASPAASIEIAEDTSVGIRIEADDEDTSVSITVESDGESGSGAAGAVDDTSVGVVLQEAAGDDSEPVLLERRRTVEVQAVTERTTAVEPAQPGAAGASGAAGGDDSGGADDGEIVVLETRKPPPATPAPPTRAEKRTQLGVGAIAALTRTARATGAVGAATQPAEPAPAAAAPPRDGRTAAAAAERTAPAAAPAPPAARREDRGPAAPPPPPADALPGPVILRPRSTTLRPAPVTPLRTLSIDDAEEDLGLGGGAAGGLRTATAVMTTVELDALIPDRRDDATPAHLERPRVDADGLDDGWGPPGTTIPPPLLGAMPGVDEDLDAGGGSGGEGRRIPVPSGNTAPLIVAPPSPPEAARGAPARAEAAGPTLARALEDATSRGVELIHALERARDRDAVVTLMIGHLAETHARAGFFSIRPSAEAGKAGELAVFKIEPGPPAPPSATLRLDRPSTLQDVVGTRLPYRGPMHDDASRSFLAGVLGACPPEILLVPVTVRERVVGVLFGEHRLRHTFDDQLALAARAAGMALERILLAKRS